jgi:hypothetical protein
MEPRRGLRRAGASWMAGIATAVALAFAPAAHAALDPQEALTYIPGGFVHNEHPQAVLEETLEALEYYGIDQNLLPVKNYKKDGLLKLTRKERTMFARWVAATSEYNAAHGTSIVAVASLGGKVKGKSLNLEDPAVRAKMVAGVRTMLELGAGGVSLDLEPYPSSPGLLALLEEIRALFAERGYTGKLGEAAPANIARWSPSYLGQVTALLDQVNPLFYDSERKTAAAYQQWVREGLAYYSANTAPGTRIVPDLPSYGTNRWHDPAAENLTTATTAVEEALAQGSRVNGAGVYWWWGFYYNEEGEGSYDGAADREAWLGRTRLVAFTP